MSNAASVFPKSERVLYGQNPLNDVICQVRYPTILRIEAEIPSNFQEKIRSRFPGFERTRNAFVGKVPQELVKALGPIAGGDVYTFTNEESETKITLSPDSLSINTGNYIEWGQFRKDVTVALQALADVYAPAYYLRIGLRYQNLIQRSGLGLEGCEWSDLLRPELAGELMLPEWAGSVLAVQKAIRCRLNEEADTFTLQHGLADVEGHSDQAYLIDFDYFNENRTEIANVGVILDRLHGHSGNAFRWAVSETLHKAMAPLKG